MSKILSCIFLFIAVLVSFPAFAYENVCSIETKYYERKLKIQSSLLSAISIVETGKWSKKKGENTSWPWTVNAKGKGMFFASKKEAVEAVRNLQKQGVKSIDVGCMQVNLKYHPNAFSSLEKAFEPSSNVAYAANFLKRLYDEHNSWFIAAKHYHSSLSEKNITYGKKILIAFETISGNDNALENENLYQNYDAKKQATLYRKKMLEKYRKNRNKRISRISKKDNSV